MSNADPQFGVGAVGSGRGRGNGVDTGKGVVFSRVTAASAVLELRARSGR